MSKSAWHINKSVKSTDFQLSKEERLALARKYRSAIRVGIAVVPFCDQHNCWPLPDGPNQQNRYVTHYDIAFEFAVRMNDILQHYPQLAVRLERKLAA